MSAGSTGRRGSLTVGKHLSQAEVREPNFNNAALILGQFALSLPIALKDQRQHDCRNKRPSFIRTRARLRDPRPRPRCCGRDMVQSRRLAAGSLRVEPHKCSCHNRQCDIDQIQSELFRSAGTRLVNGRAPALRQLP